MAIFLVTTSGVGPGAFRGHDPVGDLEPAVDLAVFGLGRRGLIGCARWRPRWSAGRGWRAGRVERRSRIEAQELWTPRSRKVFRGGDEQVGGEQAEEDVGFHAAFELGEDRPPGQRRLHVAEGVLDPGEQPVGAPGLLGVEVVAVGLEDGAAVEGLRRGAGPGVGRGPWRRWSRLAGRPEPRRARARPRAPALFRGPA